MSREIMSRIATGTRAEADAAFAELVAEHSEPLTGYAFRQLRDWQKSEDIAQAVLLSVWMHAASYRDSCFSGWIYRIAKRKIIDAVRRRRCDALSNRANPTDGFDPLDVLSVDANSPLDAMEDRESLEQIGEALAAIPAAQRAALQMYCDGNSHPEIAASSGVALATAKSRSRLAREKIRERIGL